MDWGGALRIVLGEESNIITICGGDVDLFDNKTFESSISKEISCDTSQQDECVFNGGCIFDEQTKRCKVGDRQTFTNPFFLLVNAGYLRFRSISFQNGGHID